MKQYNEAVSKRKKQITKKNLKLDYLDYMLVYWSLNSVSFASLSMIFFEDIPALSL